MRWILVALLALGPASSVEAGLHAIALDTHAGLLNAPSDDAAHRVMAGSVELYQLDRRMINPVELAERDRPSPGDRPATIDDMLRAADRSITGRDGADKGRLLLAMAALRGLRSRTFVDDARQHISDGEIGLYLYPEGRVRAGQILLHPRLSAMGTVVDWDFLAATLLHEVRHHVDDDLSPDEVIEGEVRAFQLVYRYLRHIDPTGHRLAQLRQDLILASEDRHDPLRAYAAKYTATLDVLISTRGDRDAIAAYARSMYPEKSHKSHSRNGVYTPPPPPLP